MRLVRLKSFALSLPQTTTVSQWGCLVFKVAGKVFIILSLDGALPDGISLKCTPEEFDALTERDGKLVRIDYAADAWPGAPAGAVAYWAGKVPAAGAKPEAGKAEAKPAAAGKAEAKPAAKK